MAALTWRNVDAPDFRSSMEGFNNASEAFNTAMRTAGQTINQFDGAIDARVNKQALLDIAAAPDADAATALLQSLGTRYDPNRLSAATINTATSRPGQLISEAVSRDALDNSRYNTTKSRARDARLEAANGASMRYAELVNNKDMVGAENLLRTDPSLRGLTFDEVMGMASTARGFRSGNLGLLQGDLSYASSLSSFNHGEEAYKREAAAADIAEVVRGNSFDNVTAEQYIASLNVDGQTKALVRRNLNLSGAVGDGIDPMGGFDDYGGGGGSGGAVAFDAPQQLVAVVFQKAGFKPHVIAGILGNFHVEGGYGKGQGDGGTDKTRADGGSASGIAQWRKERRDAFAQRYGKQPHEASHSEQAEFAVWELTTPEGRKASGISAADANKILNAKDEREAAALFDEYFERSDKTHRGRRVDAATAYLQQLTGASTTQQGLRNANQNRNTGTIATTYAKAAGDFRDADAVATELSAKFGGASNQPFVLQTLNKVMDRIQEKTGTARSAAVAAEIIKQSLGSSWLSRNIMPSWFSDTSTGSNIKWDKVDKEIENIRSGGLDRAVVANDYANGVAQQVQVAQAQAAAAEQRAMQARAAAASGRRVDVAGAERMAQRARQNVEMLERSVRGDPNVSNFGQPPPPPEPNVDSRAAANRNAMGAAQDRARANARNNPPPPAAKPRSQEAIKAEVRTINQQLEAHVKSFPNRTQFPDEPKWRQAIQRHKQTEYSLRAQLDNARSQQNTAIGDWWRGVGESNKQSRINSVQASLNSPHTPKHLRKQLEAELAELRR